MFFALLVILLFVGTALSALFKSFILGKQEFLRSNWFEIAIPPLIPSNNNSVFKYPELGFTSSVCIARNFYEFEFRRLFGVDPNGRLSSNKLYLIVGIHSTIGSSIAAHLQNKGIAFIGIGGPNDIDFSNREYQNIISTLPITHVILVSPTIHGIGGNAASISFIKGICEMFPSKGAKILIVLHPPIQYSIVQTIQWYGINVAIVPDFADLSAHTDLENPLIRLHQLSAFQSKPRVIASSPIHSFTGKDLAPRLIALTEAKQSSCTIFEGFHNLSIVEAAKLFEGQIEEENIIFINVNCNKEIIGSKSSNVTKMLQSQQKSLSTFKPLHAYLSIVASCIHDGSQVEDTQAFLDNLAEGKESHPLASFEVLIVEVFNSYSGQSVSERVNISNSLKGMIKFIKVPFMAENFSTDSKDLAAKNVGIRRSNGDFISVTRIGAYILPEFFIGVENAEFNHGIIYRMRSFYNSREYFRRSPLKETLKNLSLSNLIADFSSICPSWYTGVFAIQKGDMLNSDFACGCLDFIMASKDMWLAINGLNEYPEVKRIEELTLAKFFRLVPGFVHSFLPVRILAIQREPPNSTSQLKAVSIIRHFACVGDSPLASKYGDSPQWGMSSSTLEEVTF